MLTNDKCPNAIAKDLGFNDTMNKSIESTVNIIFKRTIRGKNYTPILLKYMLKDLAYGKPL